MTSKLPTRRVGTTEVSAIGYGAMGISSFYGAAAPDEERFKVTPSPCTDVIGPTCLHRACLDARCGLRVRLYLLGHRRRVRRF